jgi:hypothetical protein
VSDRSRSLRWVPSSICNWNGDDPSESDILVTVTTFGWLMELEWEEGRKKDLKERVLINSI